MYAHNFRIDINQEIKLSIKIFGQTFGNNKVYVLPLHCVFHSIRFKVNKGWDSAESFILGLYESAPITRLV